MELDYFDVFSDFQHFRFNFLHFVMFLDKLSLSFSIFLTNGRKIFDLRSISS